MELCEYRRHLHRLAEVGAHLPKTQKFILDNLSGCSIGTPWESAVTAFFDYGKNETVCFRADTDALPVNEETGLAFSSENPGVMHACGHDGHTAMLLEVAKRLKSTTATPKTNILLVFQPAEETTGGARALLESGLFAKYNVTRVFGFHLMPELEAGKIYSRPNEMMAKSSEINVDFRGRSAHIAKASEGADALIAGAGFITDVYGRIDALSDIKYKLLRFGKAQSGDVRNAISGHTRIEGSLRCFSPDGFDTLLRIIRDTADGSAIKNGCTATVSASEGYPPVINDALLFDSLKKILPEMQTLDTPCMLADDFSFYTQTVPGVYMFLGTGEGAPLHSPRFSFDESILQVGVDAYMKITFGDVGA